MKTYRFRYIHVHVTHCQTKDTIYFTICKISGQTDRQADRQAGRQIDRQAGRQADRQANTDTDSLTVNKQVVDTVNIR
jgi:hypothetical protein